MTTNLDSAFEAPKAELNDNNGDNPVLQFQRKSSWLVFFLCIITLGIYFVYWLYTRTAVLNQASPEKKVSTNLLYTYLGIYIIYTILSIIVDGTNTALSIVSGGVAIAYLVVYVMFVFSWRSVLRDVINANSTTENYVNVNGILTFFFSSLYFQYKINQAIDNTSSTENQNEQVTAA
ncbi:DUF4234 domain-containing protein [Endozoicomonas sp. G2_1]|uniref:DUF4234 domain-containing protein n=1 Tax=Endozoicomonas sp. G2_1 TaxID=2821091 RepID=UPI001ADB08CB|nr:DUF4234 domain-containing protein [Endozoicomonas sp. G2_1]MBO9489455.1 DUF4234 domain-containing protein [Endozoicomonas sp. G2_1]